MHAVTDPNEESRILELVQQSLEKYQPREYRLKVVPGTIQQEDDWYYVVVEPDRDDVRTYDYSARLAEATIDLQDDRHENILLVPALPG